MSPFQKIPQGLKALPQWLTWKKELRDGKETKIPVNPRTGGQAAVDKPSTWGTYEVALAAARNNGNAGIGFVFTDGDPFTGIDLDDAIDAAGVHPQALEVIKTFNSYTEISQSGQGLHIIIKGKLPPGGRRKDKLEMYDNRRFFVMTGAHLEDTPTTIENRQAELEAFHKKVFGKPQADPPKPAGGPGPVLDLTDFALIDKAKSATNGHKFCALWGGDTSMHSGNDSIADLALCSLLAFYTGPDPERIDRLFRQSGLYREKWERQNYREPTIAKALAGMTEFYTPGRVQEDPPEPPGPPQWTPDEEAEYIRVEQEAKRAEALEAEKTAASKPALVSLEQILSMKFPEKSELIANGIWPAGTGLMVAGESGAGKSLLLNQLVISLAMGWDFIGLKVPTARRVLVFQAENTLQQEQERYQAQIQGLEITATPQGVAYYPMSERLELSSVAVRKRMIEAIQDHRATVFFLDPLISFHAANENENSAMRQVLDYITEIMRKTGAGAGVLHHFGKPTEGSVVEHRARGASAIRDWCDTMMALTVKRKVDGYQHTVTFAKVRNGRQPRPIILDRDENLIFWVTEEVSVCPPERVAMIIKTLGGRVNGRKELVVAIRDLIDCGERTAIKFIAAAIEAGVISTVEGEKGPNKLGKTPRAYVQNDQGTYVQPAFETLAH